MAIADKLRKLRVVLTGIDSSIREEPEHEVYLAGLWDASTSHAPVLFVGSELDCKEYLLDNPQKNCQRYHARIRATGRMVTVISGETQKHS